MKNYDMAHTTQKSSSIRTKLDEIKRWEYKMDRKRWDKKEIMKKWNDIAMFKFTWYFKCNLWAIQFKFCVAFIQNGQKCNYLGFREQGMGRQKIYLKKKSKTDQLQHQQSAKM